MLPFTSVAIVCQRGLQTCGLGVFVLNKCLLLSLLAPMIWKYAHIFNLYQQNMHDSLAVPEWRRRKANTLAALRWLSRIGQKNEKLNINCKSNCSYKENIEPFRGTVMAFPKWKFLNIAILGKMRTTISTPHPLHSSHTRYSLSL